jgi:hypothetical protein
MLQPTSLYYLSMALQYSVGPWPLFQFLNLYTVGGTPWTGDQPVAGPLPTHRTAKTQNKCKQTSTPRARFEPTIPVFERAKMVHASRCPCMYEPGSARLSMSQTRLCVGRHEPGSAESGWALQGLWWGSARYWLVRVCVVPSQTRISTRPHAQTV